MKLLFFVILCSIAFPQSKMRTIKNKIKEKVDTYDKLRKDKKKEAEEFNSSKQGKRKKGLYTEQQFNYDYLFDDDDEIPWNAIITVFDGRFERIPEFDKVKKVLESRQLYQSYPFSDASFISSYSGSPYMSRFRYSYGYNKKDSINISDFDLLFAYESISMNVKYQKLFFSSKDETIEYSFASISPGLLFALNDERSYSQVFIGFGYFSISSNNIDDSKDIDRTFAGLNMGGDIKWFIPSYFSVNTRFDYTLVKYNEKDFEYFMTFFLMDLNFSYHYDRFELSIGYKMQQFNNADIKNPGNSYVLDEPYIALGLYF